MNGAAVVEIEIDRRIGSIVAKRLFAALDTGQVINPALFENQISGQMIQATSRMLADTSLDWESYPVLVRCGNQPSFDDGARDHFCNFGSILVDHSSLSPTSLSVTVITSVVPSIDTCPKNCSPKHGARFSPC